MHPSEKVVDRFTAKTGSDISVQLAFEHVSRLLEYYGKEIKRAMDDPPNVEKHEEAAILNLRNMFFELTQHLKYYRNVKKETGKDITEVSKAISVIEHALTALRSVY